MQFKKLKIIPKITIISICLVLLLCLAMITGSAFRFAEEDFAVINNRKVFLKIADTPEKQARGLMYIKKLPENYGMIFLFDRAEPRSFWMKNVEIPLDIIFIRKNKIVKIIKNVPVDKENTDTIYKSVYKSDCAIEVNAGFCDRYNIKQGDAVLLSRSIHYKWRKVKLTGNE